MTKDGGRERQLLALLFGLNQQLGDGAGLEELLQELAEPARLLVGADHLAVMLVDEGRHRLLQSATTGDESLVAPDPAVPSATIGESPAEWVAAHAEALTIADINQEPHFRHYAKGRPALSSVCAVPMRGQRGVLGVLVASSGTPGRFNDDDRDLLSYLAVAIAKDVENIRLYRLAVTDALTGAYNRQFLCDRLPEELERHRRYLQPLSIIVLDIDHFKRVNDRWGHNVGDEVLRHLTRHIVALIREVDSLVRYGGEEFLVILPSTTLDGAHTMAERLRHEVGTQPIRLREAEIYITLSAGVAELTNGDIDAMALVSRADVLLYRAKAAGRNQVQADLRIGRSSSSSPF